MGFDITHVYGLTETYGPAAVCAKQEEWASLPLAERARLNARQGVAGPMQEAMTVLDPDTMQPVPPDGETDRRDHVPRQHHDEGLPEKPLGHGGGLCRRLVPHRGSRGDRAGRLRARSRTARRT